MSEPLILTKVSLPILRHAPVARKRVLSLLGQGVRDGRLLTLVSAPAGYGKTTAIRLWAEQAGHPVAWLTLGESDNDPRQFLTYVLAALGRATADLGQAALEALESAPRLDTETILGLIANDLHDLDRPVLLVLEDYHQIDNEQIDRLLEWLLHHAIANLHLVITTREDPGLPLARLRANSQLTEIRAKELSFSMEEAGEFLSKVMSLELSPRDVEILHDRTEGWVAGLQLAGLSLRESREPSRFVEAFRGTHRNVLDYLIEEVLSRQPDEVREFLSLTSILDQLSPSLCDAVTGRDGSRRHLHFLERGNLFLVSLDAERTWYRYHALFAEILRSQLAQAEPELVDRLHGRAADWYRRSGFIHKAVEHAFRISDSGRVSALIEEFAIPMLYRGEVSIVAGWYERLPDTLVDSSAVLSIGKAWSMALMLRQASSEEVERQLLAAAEALDREGADDALRSRIAGHAASIQAYRIRSAALAARDPVRLIETSQRAQRLLPGSERGIRSVNALNIGYGYSALADLEAAEVAFQEAFDDGVAGGNFYAAIYGPISLILIAMMKGQLRQALELCETNIERFNRLLAGQSFPPIGGLHILKGSLLVEGNRLPEAELALTLGLSLERWTGEFRVHTKGCSALARLKAIHGDRGGVAECLGQLGDSRPEGAAYAQALRHRMSAPHWTVDKASLEEPRLWAMQDATRFDRQPDLAGLDPISELTFQEHLCTARVLAWLAELGLETQPLDEVDGYLARQEGFAETHGLQAWLIEIRVVRALLQQAQGKTGEARRMIMTALRAAQPLGFFRVFLDDGDRMRPLLKAVEVERGEPELREYCGRLLEAMPKEAAPSQSGPQGSGALTDRELEVVALLAAGRTYREIGQELFLSLNTVQFHVKNIYGKLMVNKRGQAIDRAKALNLI